MSIQVYLTIFVVLLLFVMIVSLSITYHTVQSEISLRVKSDITPEKMQELERKIVDFYKKMSISSDASIEEIANKLKINQRRLKGELLGQAELSEPDANGNMILTIKKGLTNEEINFVLAHECAHLINNDPLPVSRPSGQNKPEVEQIADYMAAALLMPYKEVSDYLVQNKYKDVSSRKRIAIIKKLCRTYEVSEVIALRRVNEVYSLKQLEVNS